MSKEGEMFPSSPLHTSFDSISTQTTAIPFQQSQAGIQDCFHLRSRFQEKKEEKKSPTLVGKENAAHCERTWLSPWWGVAGHSCAHRDGEQPGNYMFALAAWHGAKRE